MEMNSKVILHGSFAITWIYFEGLPVDWRNTGRDVEIPVNLKRMKKDLFERKDPQLSRILASWQVSETLPPRFQERVWKRIEAAESPATEGKSWFAALFLKPAFATVVATLMLLGGLTAGYLRAGHDTARWDAQLSQRYVVVMNPYAVGHQ